MMQKPYLMVRTSDNMVLGCLWRDDADFGPVLPQASAPDGVTLVECEAEFSRDGQRDTEVAYYAGGALSWVDAIALADTIASAVASIDGASDAARLDVISRQTNTEEYKRAEQQARDFRAAAYPSDAVPSCVASWAKAKYRDGWTAQQAADDIIATADRWYGLLDGIRDLRLCAKEDARHAMDNDEVSIRVQQFNSDLSNLMKGAS